MESPSLVALLRESVPGAEIESAPSLDLQSTLYVSRDHLPAVARALRDRDDLTFSFLAELTAADYWPREPRFELVYILVSMASRQRIRLKVRLHGADPHVATVSAIWPAANWLEREVWDLFGIAFDGHPDPRRLRFARIGEVDRLFVVENSPAVLGVDAGEDFHQRRFAGAVLAH